MSRELLTFDFVCKKTVETFAFSPTLIHFHISQNKVRGRHTVTKDLRPDDATMANSTLEMFLHRRGWGRKTG